MFGVVSGCVSTPGSFTLHCEAGSPTSWLLADLLVFSDASKATVCLVHNLCIHSEHISNKGKLCVCVLLDQLEHTWLFSPNRYLCIYWFFFQGHFNCTIMKSWRLECSRNSYGWNVGKRIISYTVLFLTNMRKLNALVSSDDVGRQRFFSSWLQQNISEIMMWSNV